MWVVIGVGIYLFDDYFISGISNFVSWDKVWFDVLLMVLDIIIKSIKSDIDLGVRVNLVFYFWMWVIVVYYYVEVSI